MFFIHILPGRFINNKDCQTSNTQLVLAHLIASDEDYKRECIKFKKSGGKIYLDNSYYEMRLNPYTIDKLIKIAKSIKADVLCLPDTKFKNEEQFYKIHQEMAKKVKRAGFKVMACVTCDKSFEIELEEFKILNSIPEINIISIPYVFRKNGDALKRWMFLDMIEEEVGIKNLKKKYHLFGTNSFYNLRQEKRSWISSADGTMPFKEAYFETPLPVSVEEEHRRPRDYFHIKYMDEEKMKILKHNIKLIKEICGDDK